MAFRKRNSGSYLPLAGGTLTGGLVGTTIAGSSFNGLTAGTATLKGKIADSSTAVACVVDNANALSTAGSQTLTVRNNGVDKAYFDKDGGLRTNLSGSIGSYGNAGMFMGAVSGFAGLWGTNGTAAPTLSNYALLCVGLDTIFNGLAGATLCHRVNNSNCIVMDGVTVAFSQKATFPATDSSGTPGAATINKPSGQVSIAAGASSVVVTNSVVTATSIVIPTLQFVDATLTSILSVVPGAGTFTIRGNANATANTKVGFLVVN